MTPTGAGAAPRLAGWLRVAFLPVILLQEHALERPSIDLESFELMSWIALAYALFALAHVLRARSVRLL